MRSLQSKKRKIFLGLAILWMLVIFAFSAQKSAESTRLSNGAGRYVVTAVNEVMDKGWNEDTVEKYALAIDHPVRKLAHATEYAILALLWFGALGSKLKSVEIAFIYACTDEIHQLFVPGRAGLFTDVLIDTSGAVVAMLILWFLCFIHKRLRSVYKKPD